MKKKPIVPQKGGIDPDCDEDISSDYKIETDEDEHSSEEMDSSNGKDEKDAVAANENESDDELGGKDESDESPYDDEDIADDDGKSHSTRGPARGKIQINNWRKNPGRVEVMYNNLGMPIGDAGTDISTLCGVLARSTIPITYNNWNSVPEELKERIWETINVSSYFACTYINVKKDDSV